MNKETTTLMLAIYGAGLSTLVFIWNIIKDLSDKGKLKVNCYVGEKYSIDVGLDPKKYLIYQVTNEGKKPIVVTHIGGTKKDKEFSEFVYGSAKLPKRLEPGEYIIEDNITDLTVLKEGLIAIWAKDSLGKTYKLDKKQFKKLINRR